MPNPKSLAPGKKSEHPAALEKILSEEPDDLAKKGREALDKAMNGDSAVHPKRLTAAESAEDLAEAAGVFADSVDTITNALLVLLGKADEWATKTSRLNYRQALTSLLVVVVAVAMGWAVWRIENIAEQQTMAREASLEVAKKQSDAAVEMKKLAEALQKTDEKVDEVKKEQEKQPAIEVVPDDKGGAKVVITPKKCDGDAKDCEPSHPAPPPSSGGKKPKPDDGAKIEIPIPGAKTAAPPVDGSAKQDSPAQHPLR